MDEGSEPAQQLRSKLCPNRTDYPIEHKWDQQQRFNQETEPYTSGIGKNNCNGNISAPNSVSQLDDRLRQIIAANFDEEISYKKLELDTIDDVI